MKNVFMIKTPLQLLNAIEAKHYFNLHAEDCVLIIMGDRKSQPQILMLAGATDEWGRVITLNEVNLFSSDPFKDRGSGVLDKLQSLKIFNKSFFYIRRLNKISRYLGTVDYIFVGYTRYLYMTHFVNVTPHNKLVYLDDGNGTIEMSEERRKGVALASKLSARKRFKLAAKKLFQGIKDDDSESASFFTVYDILPRDDDVVIKHDFSYLRSNISSLTVSDEVYFIGSPLSEVGIMSEDDYFSNLSKVNDYFGDTKLVYIAHRRDTPAKLDKIQKDLGLKVVLFEYPIEYQLAFIGPRPKVLASFFSAALDSCRLIFGEQLKIIAFRLDMTNSPKREKIESIYASYEPLISDSFILESNF